jgi:hypothetical protein
MGHLHFYFYSTCAANMFPPPLLSFYPRVAVMVPSLALCVSHAFSPPSLQAAGRPLLPLQQLALIRTVCALGMFVECAFRHFY